MKKLTRSSLRRIAALLLALICMGMPITSCSGGDLHTDTSDTSQAQSEDSSTSGTQSDTSTNEGGENDMVSPPEIIYDPILPKAKQASVLYLMSSPSNLSDRLALAAIQGITARYSEQQILVTAGAYSLYMPYLRNDYGCTVKSSISGPPITIKELTVKFKEYFKGYILCENDAKSESVHIAISLAGVLDCVVATPENEQVMKDAGLSCVLDVSDKDDAWLRASEYWDKLSRQVAVEQPSDMSPRLADYAVMCGAYFNFYDGSDMNAHAEMFGHLEDNGAVFGYNNSLGEYDTVKSLSQLNLQLVPSDHAFNLSVLSGFPMKQLEQKTAEADDTKTKNVHTVCFILSDGDNLQWITNDFATTDRWYSSSLRGSFKMGWGLPTAAPDLISPIVSYLYDKMTPQDEFIMQLSGLGYTFPSLWEKEARQAMAADVATYMRVADLSYMEILDTNGFSAEMLEDFTAQDGIEGIFYIDYADYAGEDGNIIWTNGKPTVSARYRLWSRTESTPTTLPDSLNNASTDITSQDAYSFVIVHAWSGMKNGEYGEGGSPIEAIAEVIAQLDENVEIVTPGEFMERIKENVTH